MIFPFESPIIRVISKPASGRVPVVTSPENIYSHPAFSLRARASPASAATEASATAVTKIQSTRLAMVFFEGKWWILSENLGPIFSRSSFFFATAASINIPIWERGVF